MSLFITSTKSVHFSHMDVTEHISSPFNSVSYPFDNTKSLGPFATQAMCRAPYSGDKTLKKSKDRIFFDKKDQNQKALG